MEMLSIQLMFSYSLLVDSQTDRLMKGINSMCTSPITIKIYHKSCLLPADMVCIQLYHLPCGKVIVQLALRQEIKERDSELVRQIKEKTH